MPLTWKSSWPWLTDRLGLSPSSDNTPASIPWRSVEAAELREKQVDGCNEEGTNLPWNWQYAVLQPWERSWRDMGPVLQSAGYRLRSRYHPNWAPSWEADKSLRWEHADDPWTNILGPLYPNMIDATRIQDNLPVMMKIVSESEANSTAGLVTHNSNPRNHCVKVYDCFNHPEDATRKLLVLPFLRDWHNPDFDTVGEVIDFCRQLFEGVKFLHGKGLAHRDLHAFNIMMDGRGMFPAGWHPIVPGQGVGSNVRYPAKRYTRTQRPPKYHIIDFGQSSHYNRSRSTTDKVVDCGDRSVPENQPGAVIDPFPMDVYTIAHAIQEQLLDKCDGLGFLKLLLVPMMHPDPLERPTIDEVVRTFAFLTSTLSRWKLRSPVSPRNETQKEHRSRLAVHWSRRIVYILKRIPPIPQAC